MPKLNVNYNPSTLMCLPQEQGITIDDSFVFTQNTVLTNVRYQIQIRSLYNTGVYRTAPIWASPVDPTELWWESAPVYDIEGLAVNDSITVSAQDVLTSGVIAPTAIYPTYMDSLYGKELQWRLQSSSLSLPIGSFIPVSGSDYDFEVQSGYVTSFQQADDYCVVYYKEVGTSETYDAYGYLRKLTATTFRIYKYIDGAINCVTPTVDLTLGNNITTSVSPSRILITYYWSGWMNFYMIEKGTLTIVGDPGSSRDSYYEGYIFQASYISPNNVPLAWYQCKFFDNNLNLALDSGEIYSGALSYVTSKLIFGGIYYVQFLAEDIYEIDYDSGLQMFQVRATATSNMGMQFTYTCNTDYIDVHWDYYLWNYFLWEAGGSCSLFVRKNEDNVFRFVYNFVWQTFFESGGADFDIRDFGVTCGNTYQYYLVPESSWGTFDPGVLGECQISQIITVAYEQFFLDDVTNNVSYPFNSYVSGGDIKQYINTTEYQQDLKYNAFTRSRNRYIGGQISGLLVNRTSLSDIVYGNNFREFISDNNLTYFKNRKGEIFKVAIVDGSSSLININLEEQPLVMAISYQQVGEVE